jgi:hypothetical protein
VVDPIEIQRRVRRRLERSDLRADVVADVNIAVATGGESTSVARVETHAPIHQGRSSRARREASQPKEHP